MMYMKISVIEQNVQTIESVYTNPPKIQAMWFKFVVISQGPDLNDDNNENQHLKVVLMTNNIFERGLVICMYVH